MYSFHPLGIHILSFAEFVIEKKIYTKFFIFSSKTFLKKKGQHYYKNTEIEAVRTIPKTFRLLPE